MYLLPKRYFLGNYLPVQPNKPSLFIDYGPMDESLAVSLLDSLVPYQLH